MDNLLMHQLQKFGIVTVLDATFYDTASDMPLIHFDTLKVSNISGEGSQKEIRGGQGADLLMVYDFGRTANIEITDALASMSSLSYLWGGSLTADAKNMDILVREELEVVTANTLPTLTNRAADTPVTVVVYDTNADAWITAKDEEDIPTLEGTVGFPAGAKVTMYYTKTVVTNATNGISELKLTSDNFPPTVRFVGSTFFIDRETGKKIAAQIEIPRFKLSSDFALTLDSEGEASVFDFSGMGLSHNGDVVILRTLGKI